MTRIKTGYWRSERQARDAYYTYYDDALKEGRVVIGKPPIPEGCTLKITPSGQYVIEDNK